MRKIFLLILLLACIQIQASVVKQLDVTVCLQQDGNALFTELWDIEVTPDDAKTEWYVKHDNLRQGCSICDLSVVGYVPGKERPQRFVSEYNWDVKASRSAKAGKCGINNSTEVCWGFGDYGRHQYTVSYKIVNFVQGYDSIDGFHHCFVDMNVKVENAKVTIIPAHGVHPSGENTRIWGFGYHGSAKWHGDSIVAVPNGAIGDGEGRIIIMMESDKGVYLPSSKSSYSWEKIKAEALEGSSFSDKKSSGSYGDDINDYPIYVWLLAILGFIYVSFKRFFDVVFKCLWWVVSLKPLRVYLKRKKLGIEKGKYYRSVSPGWSLVENNSLMLKLSYGVGVFNAKNIIGALLLRLIQKGYVSFVEEKIGKKMKTCLKIEKHVDNVDKEVYSDEELEMQVLYFITVAAGDDKVLQPKEFNKWAKKHAKEMKKFFKLLNVSADSSYVSQHASNVYGLKNYLEDFTLVGERHVEEVALWDEYLVYAQLFGISKQVVADIRRICPEYYEMSKFAKSVDDVDIDYIDVWSMSFYSSSLRSIDATNTKTVLSEIAGGGGSSSFGGGGGFSGGGGGGGR